MISLPEIGRLKVAGKTALEIENELIKKYVDEPLEDGEPLFKDEARDMISVVVQQIYKSNAVSKIEAEKKLLAELTSDLARSETALEAGRVACLEYIRVLEAQGKIAPGSVEDPDNAKLIDYENRMVEELELKRDQLIIIKKLGPKHSKVQALNIAIDERKKMIEELKLKSFPPEKIIQRYIVGVKQQIGDIRQVLASEYLIYRENLKKTGKSERADTERPNELVARLDNSDAAQLAAQTFLDLYFSGDIEKATELTNNPRPLKTLQEFVNPGTGGAPTVDGFSGGRFEANVFADGVVPLKKALPRTGHKQAEISLRMQNSNSDGWRVLQVLLEGVPTETRKAPLLDKDIIRPFPVGNKPPASNLGTFTLLFKEGSKTPHALMEQVSIESGDIPLVAPAEPVAKLQGRWRAKSISIEGKEVALDSALAEKVQLSDLIVDGKIMRGSKPDRREFLLLAYPQKNDAAILVALDQPTRTTSLRFAVKDDHLRVAISDVYDQADIPPLKQGDDVIYIEYERASDDPSALNPVPEKPSSSTSPTDPPIVDEDVGD